MRARTFVIHALLLGAGCSYYDSSLLDAPWGTGGAAGSSGAAGAAGAAGVVVTDASTCGHALPPDKPAVTNAGGTEDLVFAVDWVKIADRDLGYDRDKTCTCQGEADSCQEPAWANADHCDGAEGRDNAAGALIQEGGNLVPGFGDADWNSQLREGKWSIIYRVRNYNGLADDDQVELAWYVPRDFDTLLGEKDGGTPTKDGGVLPLDASTTPMPKWDGTDEWPLNAGSMQDGDRDRPVWKDPNAYVSGGVLVGLMPLGEMQATGSLKLVLTDAFVTARLVREAGVWRMKDGVLSGIWLLEDIFKQLGYMTIGGVNLCTNSIAYSMVKGMICKYADIYRSRGTPSSQCDSLSFGLSFTAVAGKLGQALVNTSTPKGCNADVDPATDTCGAP